MRPREEYLVNVEPTIDEQLANLPVVDGFPVQTLTNAFLQANPHYHPDNQGVWDIQVIKPPFPMVPRSGGMWPPVAIVTDTHKCGNGAAVFHRAELLDDGSLRLGGCFRHANRPDYCSYSDAVLPVVKARGIQSVFPPPAQPSGSTMSGHNEAPSSPSVDRQPVQPSDMIVTQPTVATPATPATLSSHPVQPDMKPSLAQLTQATATPVTPATPTTMSTPSTPSPAAHLAPTIGHSTQSSGAQPADSSNHAQPHQSPSFGRLAQASRATATSDSPIQAGTPLQPAQPVGSINTVRVRGPYAIRGRPVSSPSVSGRSAAQPSVAQPSTAQPSTTRQSTEQLSVVLPAQPQNSVQTADLADLVNRIPNNSSASRISRKDRMRNFFLSTLSTLASSVDNEFKTVEAQNATLSLKVQQLGEENAGLVAKVRELEGALAASAARVRKLEAALLEKDREMDDIEEEHLRVLDMIRERKRVRRS